MIKQLIFKINAIVSYRMEQKQPMKNYNFFFQNDKSELSSLADGLFCRSSEPTTSVAIMIYEHCRIVNLRGLGKTWHKQT